MNYENLIPSNFDLLIREWLKQDLPSFDIGGYVVGNKSSKAVLLGKSNGILAGKPFFEKIFNFLDCKVEWLREEGSLIKPITEIAYVTGPINKLLIGERLALNIITRASGVATQANKIIEQAKNLGFSGKIAGTRKTTPGFRLIEKYGLIVGGADTHRMDLSSMVMLKDNHIASAGSITKAVTKAKKISSVWTKIEVECKSLEQALEALNAGAEIVMLDNFTPSIAIETAITIKKTWPKAIIEVSGGINKENISNFYSNSIDIISLGILTTNYSPIDYSLKIVEK